MFNHPHLQLNVADTHFHANSRKKFLNRPINNRRADFVSNNSAPDASNHSSPDTTDAPPFYSSAMHKAVRKTVLFLCFWLFTAQTLRAANLPKYELIELNLPSSQSSFATALNNQNEIVGYTVSNDVEIGFLWKNQTLTLLPAFEGQSHPYSINNLGEIVGSAKTNGQDRAWKFSNGLNIDLAPLAGRPTSARSINDFGDIVGIVDLFTGASVDFPFVARFADTVERLSGIYVWDTSGATVPPEPNVSVVNNNRFVVGRHFGAGSIWTNLSTIHPRPISTSGRSDALGLNASNQVVGSFQDRYSHAQAGLWISNEWIALPSSLHANASARSINDAGTIVGTQIGLEGSAALVWKNSAGADLNSFVNLPAGARLTEAIAVNNSGAIAAHLTQDGRIRAVLLKPISNEPIPTLSITGLTNRVYDTNDFRVSIETDYDTNQTRAVRYTLFKHIRTVRRVTFYDQVFLEAQPAQTNIATGADLSATFEDLSPGAYVLAAELRDTNGVVLYASEQRFVVGGSATLATFLPPSETQFDINLITSVGREYVLETSTNLVDWQALTNPPTTGGIQSLPGAKKGSRFYRALVHREAPDIYPTPASFFAAPTTLANRTLSLGMSGTSILPLQFTASTFQANSAEFGPLSGSYFYQASGLTATLNLIDPATPELRFYLNLTFTATVAANPQWLTLTGTYNGTQMIEGSESLQISGNFTLQ